MTPRRLVLSALALGLAGCPAEPRATAPTPAWSLRVLAAGDVGSDTDVCGCKVRRLGGVARRAQLVAERPGALVLDGGDLFFRAFGIPPGHRPQAEATAALHADALRRMGARAMVVGERDLALGVGPLRRLGRRAGVALLSANLVHAETGTAAFPGFTVLEHAGRRVGVVGLSPPLGPEAPSRQAYANAGLRPAPAQPALEAAARAAEAAGAEVLVGLFHLGLEASQRAVSRLPPGRFALVLVAGEGRSGPPQLSPDRKTAFVELGERGKYLADVELRLIGGDAFVDAAAVAEERRILAELEARVEALAADATQADLRARLVKRRDRMQATLRRVEAEGGDRFSAELVPVTEDTTRDPKLARRYELYLDALSAVNAAPPSETLGYVGHEACGACHAPALAHWRRTAHAEAWATLVKKKQTSNLDCVRCHVTGFEQPGGPRRLADLEGLKNVGCESCHGAGAAHAEDPEGAPLSAAVPESVCASCHREQGDQKPFVYSERRPRVLGEGHGAAPE